MNEFGVTASPDASYKHAEEDETPGTFSDDLRINNPLAYIVQNSTYPFQLR